MPSISGLSDAMSDVLSLVRMEGEFVSASEYSAPWSLSFKRQASRFHIVERGVAWIVVEGGEPVRLESGDLAVLPLGAGHIFTSDPALVSVPIDVAIATMATKADGVTRLGGGGGLTEVVCGQFSFAGILAPKLLEVLPPLILIRPERGKPLEWLRLTTHFLVEETRNPRPGSALMIERLLDLLFIQAIREWGAKGPTGLGWMSGLRDPQVGKALSAIHENPVRTWIVEDLAGVAGLSRSAFAARFTDLVGQTPLKYVATWRLNLAADFLRASSLRVGEIAGRVGYGSEAALNRAFKSQFGTTPAEFRKQAQKA